MGMNKNTILGWATLLMVVMGLLLIGLGAFRQNLNLMIVWILGGFWHGATYGYLLWGIYCGFQIVIYSIYFEFKSKYFEKISNYRYLTNIRNADYSIEKQTQIGIKLRVFLIKLFRAMSIFFTFILFGLGLLLFRIESFPQLMRLMDNLSGFYLNEVLIVKLLFYISPILILDSLQFYNEDLEYFNSTKINPIVAYGLLLIFSIQFCLFSVFENKIFFYFQY